jgi:hypothetical protein
MAPSALETLPTAPHLLSRPARKQVDKTLFPDGIKTSGQHPPLYDQLRPYSDFPREITGGTVWKPEDYTDNLESWVHEFSSQEVAELSAAADTFLADGTPLTGISKVNIAAFAMSTTHTSPGQLPSSAHIVCTVSVHSGRDNQWQGLYPAQRTASGAMGKSQIGCCIYGIGDASRLFCQSEWPWTCPWARQRSRRGCQSNRQSPHL